MYIVKQDINHFNVSVHKPSHIIWSWTREQLNATTDYNILEDFLADPILNSSIGINYSFLLA